MRTCILMFSYLIVLACWTLLHSECSKFYKRSKLILVNVKRQCLNSCYLYSLYIKCWWNIIYSCYEIKSRGNFIYSGNGNKCRGNIIYGCNDIKCGDNNIYTSYDIKCGGNIIYCCYDIKCGGNIIYLFWWNSIQTAWLNPGAVWSGFIWVFRVP